VLRIVEALASGSQPENPMMNIQLAEQREEAALDDCRLQP
jgi:hypothetical protein